MIAKVTQALVKDNIEQGIQACQKLLILMEDERRALKERDTTALERIIRDKSANLLALEQTAKQRSTWLDADSADAALEQAWLQYIGALDSQLGQQWLQFKSLLDDCRTHNEINGKMLARSQQVVKRLVGMVRGQTDHQPLYSPKGRRGMNNGYHNLGEA